MFLTDVDFVPSVGLHDKVKFWINKGLLANKTVCCLANLVSLKIGELVTRFHEKTIDQRRENLLRLNVSVTRVTKHQTLFPVWIHPGIGYSWTPVYEGPSEALPRNQRWVADHDEEREGSVISVSANFGSKWRSVVTLDILEITFGDFDTHTVRSFTSRLLRYSKRFPEGHRATNFSRWKTATEPYYVSVYHFGGGESLPNTATVFWRNTKSTPNLEKIEGLTAMSCSEFSFAHHFRFIGKTGSSLTSSPKRVKYQSTARSFCLDSAIKPRTSRSCTTWGKSSMFPVSQVFTCCSAVLGIAVCQLFRVSLFSVTTLLSLKLLPTLQKLWPTSCRWWRHETPHVLICHHVLLCSRFWFVVLPDVFTIHFPHRQFRGGSNYFWSVNCEISIVVWQVRRHG